MAAATVSLATSAHADTGLDTFTPELESISEFANVTEDLGLENVEQGIGDVGANINNPNAQNVANHSTVMELSNEVPDTVLLSDEEDGQQAVEGEQS
ncbi:hypothetical protein [Streptodolium elevatio]